MQYIQHEHFSIPRSGRILKFQRLARLAPMVGKYQRYPSQIPTVPPLTSVTMYNYHPRLLAKSNIEKQYFSHRVNDVCNGSPSRILRVRLISFGITILPRSSTRRTMPVAFIVSSPLKRVKARFLPVAVFAGKGELCMGRWEKRKGTLGEIAALDSNNRCRFCIIMPMHCLLP